MKRLVIDASVILRAFFPDEEGQEESQALIEDWIKGRVEIVGPSLLFLEVTNAVLVAVRRGRIPGAKACEIIQTLKGLSIPVTDSPDIEEVFKLAFKHNLSAYDATYVTFAVKTYTLITGDEKLYQALKSEGKVLWLGDYKQA